MMTGKLYIDNHDAYTTFGAYVVQGGWNGLLEYPVFKSLTVNTWQESDGDEVDLSAPILGARTVTLRLVVKEVSGYVALTALLNDGAYHSFNCAEIGKTFHLRVLSHTGLEYAIRFSMVTLRLSDDFPMEGYTYQAPSTSLMQNNDFLLDDVSLSAYGIRVLEGSLNTAIMSASTKQALTRNISILAGTIYDGAFVTLTNKQVDIHCLLRADTLEEMWRNYQALLYDLARPSERKLTVTGLEHNFYGYYLKNSVTEFSVGSSCWLKFTLTLSIIRNIRLGVPTCRLVGTSLRLADGNTIRFVNQ